MSLSEQSLVDCSWGCGNIGCDGGESERAYTWIMKSGCLPTEVSYGQYLMQVLHGCTLLFEVRFRATNCNSIFCYNSTSKLHIPLLCYLHKPPGL